MRAVVVIKKKKKTLKILKKSLKLKSMKPQNTVKNYYWKKKMKYLKKKVKFKKKRL